MLCPLALERRGREPPHGANNGALAGGKPQPPDDRFLFWVRLEGGRRYQGKRYYAVRQGDWKLLQNDASEPLRLYNLADDPKETTDLAQRRPEIFRKLKAALDAHISRCAQISHRLPNGAGPGEIGEATGPPRRPGS